MQKGEHQADVTTHAWTRRALGYKISGPRRKNLPRERRSREKEWLKPGSRRYGTMITHDRIPRGASSHPITTTWRKRRQGQPSCERTIGTLMYTRGRKLCNSPPLIYTRDPGTQTGTPTWRLTHDKRPHRRQNCRHGRTRYG